MRASTLIRLISVALLPAILPVEGMGQSTANGAPAGVAEAMLRVEGVHQAINCLKKQEAAAPVVYAPDNTTASLSYQDQQFKLGCAVSGFTEYFAPSRWAAFKINGDGGVDVTGAPNSILVEGANRASVIATPGSAASYRIAIPAEGYVSFNWKYIGGSNLFNRQFWVEVNGERAESMAEGHTAGNFFSSLLSSGDELAFNIVSDVRGFEIQLSDFEFLSNAIGVIERRWEARTDNGLKGQFTQFVSIKKPDFSQVVFPGNYDGSDYPLINSGVSIDPEWTGYPFIDEDGSIVTRNDQYPLADDGCAFSLKWEDEMLYDEGTCIVFRHWIVSDYCGDNVQEHTQVIKVRGGCPEGGKPLPYGQQVAPENGKGPSIPGQQRYSSVNIALQANTPSAEHNLAPPLD
ncbi:MAG: hypothetical protein KDD19_04765 [Phaeodactylibacter sp.]|nr:hypothetical protein [Phaeodactylibacter sp.]MCB9048489.1 hypothetical protein [Lewinellaceae bacterium]